MPGLARLTPKLRKPFDPTDPQQAILRWAYAKKALGRACAKCDLRRAGAACQCAARCTELDEAEAVLFRLAGMRRGLA